MPVRRRSNSRPVDVAVAGLAVVDIIGRPVSIHRLPDRGGLQLIDSITLTTGGNVPNVGIDLAKLGFTAAAITRVGEDALGHFIRTQLTRNGVDVSGLTVDGSTQTSSTIVCVDPGGERTFLHTRGCLKGFRARDIRKKMGLLKRAKILAFGYLGLLPECEPELPELFAEIRGKAATRIFLDTGGTPRRNDRLLKKLLPHVDYFVPSRDEAAILTGEESPGRIVARLRAFGATGVVGVKLGGEGCFMNADGREELIPPLKVRRVIDATGAGDAFVSGFLAGTLRGYDPFAAARIGNAVAASSIQAVGASTAIRPFKTYLRNR